MGQGSEPSELEQLATLMNSLAEGFENRCQDLLESEENPFEFLGENVIDRMLNTLAETVNRCREQAVKLMFLQLEMTNAPELQQFHSDGELQTGFKKTGESWS
jgi:hypothetical protein